MIYAVRLKPYNKKKGYVLRSYKSFYGKKSYRLGVVGQPSPVYIVKDIKEIEELRTIDAYKSGQLDITPFGSEDEIKKFVKKETEALQRKGQFVVDPIIETVKTPKTKTPSIDDVMLPDQMDVVSDEIEESEEEDETYSDPVGEMKAEVIRIQAKLDNAISKDFKPHIIKKWENKLFEAKELLNKAELEREIEE